VVQEDGLIQVDIDRLTNNQRPVRSQVM